MPERCIFYHVSLLGESFFTKVEPSWYKLDMSFTEGIVNYPFIFFYLLNINKQSNINVPVIKVPIGC